MLTSKDQPLYSFYFLSPIFNISPIQEKNVTSETILLKDPHYDEHTVFTHAPPLHTYCMFVGKKLSSFYKNPIIL